MIGKIIDRIQDLTDMQGETYVYCMDNMMKYLFSKY